MIECSNCGIGVNLHGNIQCWECLKELSVHCANTNHRNTFNIIFQFIKNNKDTTFTEIQRFADVSRPVLSYHLKMGLESKILQVRKQGRNRFYSIIKEMVK